MGKDLIAAELLSEHGDAVHESRELYSFRAGQTEALYDPYNKRLKLFELTPQDIRDSGMIASAISCSEPNELYSKIIVYANPGVPLAEFGLRQEALIRGFFEGGRDAHLWCAYPDPERGTEQNKQANDEGIAIAQAKSVVKPALPEGYSSAAAELSEAEEVAELLLATFEDYPVPITPERICGLMQDRSLHFRVIRNGDGQMVAAASAEISHRRKSAELTDCATRDDQRGKGLMTVILADLEQDLRTQFGISDVYTIARAVEVGMNCSFAKRGYKYTGRLVNNCRMPGGWESMNVWCSLRA